MAPTQANRRLQKEYANLAKNPPPYIIARPNETNLLETHFVLRGPEDSPYVGGEYWGILTFTSAYPFAPPAIKVMTPSGRFQPDRKICTSMSDFHPGSWNPAWSIETILCGLLSFMLDSEVTTGSIRSSDAEKVAAAKASHSWNIKQPRFKLLFPEYAEATIRDLPNMGVKERNLPNAPSTNQTSTGSTGAGPSSVSSSLASARDTLLHSPSAKQALADNVQNPANNAASMLRSFWFLAGAGVVALSLILRLTTTT